MLDAYKSTSGLRVDGNRLWDSLLRLAQIGSTKEGSVCRTALTEVDRQGRDFFINEARAAGCMIRTDKIGNIFALRPGKNPDLPVIMAGGHIDMQPIRGKFDGTYGVMAGIEVVRALNDAEIETEASLEVVAWSNEEGDRFAPIMMGAGTFVGELKIEDMLQRKDREGITVAQALEYIGYWICPRITGPRVSVN